MQLYEKIDAMELPICGFDAKNAILCLQCESKLESGKITKADVKASYALAKLGKTNPEIEKFTLSACKEMDGNYVIYLNDEDILAIRQSRTLYRLIQDEFPGRIWIVGSNNNDKKFIEDLLFPTRVLSINSVWGIEGTQKTKAIVSGKWTPKFPIDINKVIHIVKHAKDLDVEIEFEKSNEVTT